MTAPHAPVDVDALRTITKTLRQLIRAAESVDDGFHGGSRGTERQDTESELACWVIANKTILLNAYALTAQLAGMRERLKDRICRNEPDCLHKECKLRRDILALLPPAGQTKETPNGK